MDAAFSNPVAVAPGHLHETADQKVFDFLTDIIGVVIV